MNKKSCKALKKLHALSLHVASDQLQTGVAPSLSRLQSRSQMLAWTILTILPAPAWQRHWCGVKMQCLTVSSDVQVSGNHRLDDNKAERQRLSELGRELSSSAVEGRPVGPLRVWPGGLAMSRTLGDNEVWAATSLRTLLTYESRTL